MYQAQIKEKKLSLMRKPGSLSEMVLFLEQQHGQTGIYTNKVYFFSVDSIFYFLCEDHDFAHLLAEALSTFTKLNQ